MVGNTKEDPSPPAVAGNGLLPRRVLLQGGLKVAGGLVAGGMLGLSPVHAQGRPPGAPLSTYGSPSRYESHVKRSHYSKQAGTSGSGASRTPLQYLQGTITPASLHFERHHSGVPDIDPAKHRLIIHGSVRRNLQFSLADLMRYPMVTRQMFLECSGNSAVNLAAQPQPLNCGEIHGLVSGSEWTGVPLSILLDEVGIDKQARWVVAEGADAARMNRSIPIEKMLDDALLALYQNGERLRPENGYPMRLFLPGYEGNMSVKWLRYLQVSRTPAMSREETSKYTDVQADGMARAFTFPMAVKSVITSPSPGLDLAGPGVYEISGLAWSGHGPVEKVDISADGGNSWGQAELEGPVLSRGLTRFRMAWRWNGAPCVLMSRASDGGSYGGDVQPSRDTLIARWGQRFVYHYNAIQAWQVGADGKLANTYG